ncbi:acetyl-CoA synthetase-like protein [Agrocybe pediades]|nr:acetyl-CoA synthetase-like protein [Agrocybe pediades]
MHSEQPETTSMSTPRYLATAPKTQSLSSETFTPPPLDGSLTLPEIFDWHLQHSSSHPLYVYRQDGHIRTILWPEAVRAVYAGVEFVRKAMDRVPGVNTHQVVAILAPSEAISYSTFMVSIMRAGHTVFPISPKNSAAAVAHLISKVRVGHIFLGSDAAISELGVKALQIVKAEHPGLPAPSVSPMVVYRDLYTDSVAHDDAVLPPENKGPNHVAMYLHTSGSTSFPKIIGWTNYRVAQLSLTPYFGEMDMTGAIFSVHSLPAYHTMGLTQLLFTSTSGLIVSTFEPKSPPIIPTAQNVLEAAVGCKSDLIYCVPSFVEEWSRKPHYIRMLTKTKGVLSAGGPLEKAVGDYLIYQGVPLYSLYGSTELGAMTPFIPGRPEKDWDYFRFSDMISAHMISQGDGTYECICTNGPFCELTVTNTKLHGVHAFSTLDLFTPHPHKPGYWRLYGRVDDQIMHSTGEKTNPGPLEKILNQDPHIHSSVIFGHGRLHTGVIVEPKSEFVFDPDDEEKLAEFREKIWPTVLKLNEFAPRHSRIFKEMIIVSKSSKPFAYTSKITPRRQLIVDVYEEEIEALYDALPRITQFAIMSPIHWELEEVRNFVRANVIKVLGHVVDDTTNLFQCGCDSLQAIWIRNILLRSLQSNTRADTSLVVDTFVYDHPTILLLASYMVNLASGRSEDNLSSRDIHRTDAMRALVDQHISNLPIPAHAKDRDNVVTLPDGDIVLATGTTGALGAHLLTELVQAADVTRIYAVNRRSSTANVQSLKDRQKEVLLHRGLNPDSILTSGKLVLVEADLSLPGLGINEELYEEIRSSITHIVHNAWPVNFNWPLSSFDESIHGLRNLIQLALSSPRPNPPSFMFVSTIALANQSDSLESSVLALHSGYVESKWVSEQILHFTSSHSQMKSIIARVGQLTGGSNGSWNTNEWFPSLVKSSRTMGCFPTDGRVVDWIPPQSAAKALVACRSYDSSMVIVSHPQPISWKTLATVIADCLNISLVTFRDWLGKLEDLAKINPSEENGMKTINSLPALRMVAHYRFLASNTQGYAESIRPPIGACSDTLSLSDASSHSLIPQLCEEDVHNWMTYWRDVGFL